MKSINNKHINPSPHLPTHLSCLPQRAPFVKLEMVGEEIVGATGFCIEMLDEMARKFNFT
ncbi:hypothetical protein E2C01_102670 [Portunus trituberculatus]|uniref:Uncharacterized protein n=1 Tax=Portunus trituberculatus TaxID=210409 RepID=A0A5B7KNC1_PORTR|nr:hypothetical protein [Portunus trituberculatus]